MHPSCSPSTAILHHARPACGLTRGCPGVRPRSTLAHHRAPRGIVAGGRLAGVAANARRSSDTGKEEAGVLPGSGDAKEQGSLADKAKDLVVEAIRDGGRRPIEMSNAMLDVQTNNPQVLWALGVFLMVGLIASFVFDL